MYSYDVGAYTSVSLHRSQEEAERCPKPYPPDLRSCCESPPTANSRRSCPTARRRTPRCGSTPTASTSWLTPPRVDRRSTTSAAIRAWHSTCGPHKRLAHRQRPGPSRGCYDRRGRPAHRRTGKEVPRRGDLSVSAARRGTSDHKDCAGEDQRAGAGGGGLSVVRFSWVRACRPWPKGPWSSGYEPLSTNVLEGEFSEVREDHLFRVCAPAHLGTIIWLLLSRAPLIPL
jgi:hypothetical protein